MRVGILVTNGGDHTADTWAAATAGYIFPLDGVTDAGRRVQAMALQVKIAEALLPHHDEVQTTEKEHLQTRAADRMAEPLDGFDVDAAVKAVQAAAAGTPWEDHFKRPEVVTAISQIIGEHFATSQHTSRLWHADNNPGCEVSQAYRAQFHG